MTCPKCGYEPPTAAELAPALTHLARAVGASGLRPVARDVGIGPTTLLRAISRPQAMTEATRGAIDHWNTSYDRMLVGILGAIEEETQVKFAASVEDGRQQTLSVIEQQLRRIEPDAITLPEAHEMMRRHIEDADG